MMKNFLKMFVASIFFCACTEHAPVRKTKQEPEAISDKLPSEATVKAIKSKFPGALPFQQGIDSIIENLEQHNIKPDDILWGQSTCVDDIINTKNRLKPEIKGPFNFGGLAGLPFTGISGLIAFSHHVPEGGTALLFVGPHIGFNENEGWGKILRHDQTKPTTCCGALAAALEKLKQGKIRRQTPSPEDYQEGMIEQLALAHQQEILNSPDQLLALTHLTYKEAIREMTFYASQVKGRHFKYAVIVGGIIINTDYASTDYLSIETIAILDVHKNEWITGEKPRPGR